MNLVYASIVCDTSFIGQGFLETLRRNSVTFTTSRFLADLVVQEEYSLIAPLLFTSRIL